MRRARTCCRHLVTPSMPVLGHQCRNCHSDKALSACGASFLSHGGGPGGGGSWEAELLTGARGIPSLLIITGQSGLVLSCNHSLGAAGGSEWSPLSSACKWGGSLFSPTSFFCFESSNRDPQNSLVGKQSRVRELSAFEANVSCRLGDTEDSRVRFCSAGVRAHRFAQGVHRSTHGP